MSRARTAHFFGGSLDGQVCERIADKHLQATARNGRQWKETYVRKGRDYHLESTEDITEQMSEAEERIREQTWQTIFGDES